MISRNELLDDLAKDPIRNASLINFVQECPVKTIDRAGQSFLIRGFRDYTWSYISSANREEFTELLSLLTDEDEYFASIEDWMLADLLQGQAPSWKLSCVKLYFPPELQVPEPVMPLHQLGPEYAEYIFDHSKYQDIISEKYIRMRLELGYGLGIFRDKKLVAWIITHYDGAMGLLHVLPEYWGLGYGQDVTYAMIQFLRERNELPYVHIEDNNIETMSLAVKTGFHWDRLVHWFRRGK